MNTAIATPVTEQADRFRCEAEVPDPPRDAAGRKQYWEDTVAEAVAELRRRLAGGRGEKSFQALEMILDLEKTRLRHKTPVAGTETGGGYSSPLPPMEQCVPGGRSEGPKKKDEDLTPPASAAPAVVSETVAEEAILPTSPRRGEVGCDAAGRGAASPALADVALAVVPDTVAEEPILPTSPRRGEVGCDATGRGAASPALGDGSRQTDLLSYPFPPKPLRPIPLHIRLKLQDGIHGRFHDHDDDWMHDPDRLAVPDDTE